MTDMPSGDLGQALAQPFTPGMGNGFDWESVPDEVAVAAPWSQGEMPG